jgi:hypothetical protein
LTSVLRKPSQEVEIDHLLAEEFACDPSFGQRFLKAFNLPSNGFSVSIAVAEPSLGGEGFGDLLVEGQASGKRFALLIENKITAGPAVRQAARYKAHAAQMRDEGWDEVLCILVAPSAYLGERAEYDANLNLEDVAGIMRSQDPVRLKYRQHIIGRALQKVASTGVRIPDPKMHRLRSMYLEYANNRVSVAGEVLEFPSLRASYYEGPRGSS